ncbi:MAG: ABC-type transport auxiliary lipoprotein family protein [Pseudomonadota bacterium]
MIRKATKGASKGLAAVLVSCVAMSLAACVSVLPEAAPAAPRFGVNDIEPTSPVKAPVTWRLSIDDPLATRAIDSTKIALTKNGHQFQYYSGGEWADRAPRLFQAALIRSFQNTDGIVGVGSRSTQPIADYILQTDLRAFEAKSASGELQAVVEIYARVTNIRGKTFSAKRFRQERSIGSDTAVNVAGALNGASGEIIEEMIDWSIASIETAEAAKSFRP